MANISIYEIIKQLAVAKEFCFSDDVPRMDDIFEGAIEICKEESLREKELTATATTLPQMEEMIEYWNSNEVGSSLAEFLLGAFNVTNKEVPEVENKSDIPEKIERETMVMIKATGMVGEFIRMDPVWGIHYLIGFVRNEHDILLDYKDSAYYAWNEIVVL